MIIALIIVSVLACVFAYLDLRLVHECNALRGEIAKKRAHGRDRSH